MRGSRLAAGYDLSSAYDLVVPARGKALVKTDLEMAIPEGCYGRVGEGGAIPCAPPRRAAPCAPPRRPAAHHNLLCRGLRSHASCLSWCAAPRSGLAWKNFIDTGAGVIDADYRGNVGVILFNHSEDDFQGAPRHPASPWHPPQPRARA